MTHLSRHLNDRLDKRGVGDSVGHREDGSHRGHMVDDGLDCVGKDGGGVGGNGVCENGGRVGEKRGRVCGYREGEGVGVCRVCQQNCGVGFRPGQAKRGHGENSKLKL